MKITKIYIYIILLLFVSCTNNKFKTCINTYKTSKIIVIDDKQNKSQYTDNKVVEQISKELKDNYNMIYLSEIQKKVNLCDTFLCKYNVVKTYEFAHLLSLTLLNDTDNMLIHIEDKFKNDVKINEFEISENDIKIFAQKTAQIIDNNIKQGIKEEICHKKTEETNKNTNIPKWFFESQKIIQTDSVKKYIVSVFEPNIFGDIETQKSLRNNSFSTALNLREQIITIKINPSKNILFNAKSIYKASNLFEKKTEKNYIDERGNYYILFSGQTHEKIIFL